MSISRLFWAFSSCRDGSCASGTVEGETVTEDIEGDHLQTGSETHHYHNAGLFDVVCAPSRERGCMKDDSISPTGPDGGIRSSSEERGHSSPTEENGGPRYEAEAEVPSLLEQVRQMLYSANCQPQRRDPLREDSGEHPQETQLLHEAMMTFIRTLLRGVCIEVLLDDGSVLFPEASLNYELTHLILHVNENEAQRAIALKDVESVATPLDLEQRNIVTSIQPYLDERCCTLIIRDYEFVTFRFDTERLREYFASCLRLLITAPSGEPPAAALEIASEIRDNDALSATRTNGKASADAADAPGSSGVVNMPVVEGPDAGASQPGANDTAQASSSPARLDEGGIST